MFRGEGFDFMKNVLDPNNFISLYFFKNTFVCGIQF